MGRLRSLIDDGERFFRGSYFGYTWLLILLGAGSVNPEPSLTQIVLLICLGLNYHFFGYIHNDLIDLPLDRLQPRRATDPLVTGRISTRTAWLFALIQIPISYGLLFWGDAEPNAYLFLTFGYVATVLYNVYGKRSRIPMVTDAVQGTAWACLALVGAYLVGTPNQVTWIPAAFGFAFVFLINGVHASLRDLENDFANDQRTTSIFLGARALADGSIRTTAKLQAFAYFAFILLLAPTSYIVLSKAIPVEYLTIGLWLGVNAFSFWCLRRVVQTESPDRLKFIFTGQLPFLLPPVIIMVSILGWPLRLTLLAALFLPYLVFIADLRHFASYLVNYGHETR